MPERNHTAYGSAKALVEVRDVGLNLPVYDVRSRSLKLNLVNLNHRGTLRGESQHLVVGILHGISFTLVEGDRLGIIGVNGAGKSTLLRVLAGIYAPTTGHVATRGRVVPLLDITLGMDEHSTGRQNIYLRSLFLGMGRRAIMDRMEEIIAFSELGEYIDLPIRTYSSGMRLRLAFAVSTAVDPDILLLDEVVGVGDMSFQAKAKARMAELHDRAKIVILAIHANDVIRSTCTKALWLEGGRIKAYGPSEDVANAYESANGQAQSLP